MTEADILAVRPPGTLVRGESLIREPNGRATAEREGPQTMNRREALTALAAIPAVTGLQFTETKIEPEIGPHDLIVVQFPGRVSMEAAERIKALIERELPGRTAFVIGDGGRVSVVRGVLKVDA
jgi:hypothetical protein